MKMVAAARFRRAQMRVTEGRPYAEKINELIDHLLGEGNETTHPLLERRDGSKKVVVVLTSDRGLCGAFNANLFRLAKEEFQKSPPEQIVSLGKKGNAYFSRHHPENLRVHQEFWEDFSYRKSSQLIRELAQKFLNKEIDGVDVIYNEFHSVISQKPKKISILPFVSPSTENEKKNASDVIFEPGEEEIVNALVPRAMEVQFYLTCLNSLASEFGARMTAMDSASRNAEDMISQLTLKMNRARQAGITTELMEIIGGAEALSEG